MAELKKAKLIRIEGVVYCHTHGSVHEDTLDPYGYGEPSCLTEAGPGVTRARVHRTVYYRARKGDWEE